MASLPRRGSTNEPTEPGPCTGRGGASGTRGKVAGISLSSENRGATGSGWVSKGAATGSGCDASGAGAGPGPGLAAAGPGPGADHPATPR